MAALSDKSTSNVVFQYGPLWDESLADAIKDTPNIVQKIKEFTAFKSQNPVSSYNVGDRPFKGEGIYRQYLPKAVKAHLTRDISIIYELSGRNPIVIKLYGVFTHADLGTGNPANLKIQKNMAKRLSR